MEKKHICICGSVHRRSNFSKHKKSLKHREFTKNIILPRPIADPIVYIGFDF
jgi:hypothetical protein